jgi:acid phosphatase (class A)
MPLTSDNMGNMGNMGIAPSSMQGAYPAGSLPFADALTKTPPATATVMPPRVGHADVPFKILKGRVFPFAAWGPAFRAQVVLADFAATKWAAVKEKADPKLGIILGGSNTFDSVLVEELNYLREVAAPKRAGRMTEIIAQADDASPYWSDMLLAGPSIRPFTWTLVEIGRAVGQMIVMHFKAKYNRPRPAQVYPALMPPILTPPHPSYPNSHALQSLLMSGCAAAAVPDLEEPLIALARRVGENREIAGLHYLSDRKASEHIAAAVLEPLKQCGEFQNVLAAAKKEWRKR